MPSYVEISNMVEAGLKSEHYTSLVEFNSQDILSEEQLALMALICDNAKYTVSHCAKKDFIHEVVAIQNLMSGTGKVRSRQILCLMARMAGIE